MAVTITEALRVATLNVRGLSARRRQYQLSRLSLEEGLDVLALQETKVATQEQADRMVQPFTGRYNVCVCHAAGTSGGCALLFRKSLDTQIEAVMACESGRLVVADVLFNGLSWRFICVYAPNNANERLNFFEQIEVYLQCDRLIVMLGDFNCVCSAHDRSTNVPVRDKSANLLSRLTHECQIEDVGSVFTPGTVCNFTHFQRGSNARLDRAYVSIELLPACNSYDVKHVSFTDHSLVLFTLGRKKESPKFNWELWKFNERLLEDEDFMNSVQSEIAKILSAVPKSYCVVWEEFKSHVKKIAIERGSCIRRSERKAENELRKQLDELVSLENEQPGKWLDEIRDVKNKLEIMDGEKYRAAMIRARAEKLWAGEKPSKRALGDEKRYATKNEIKQINFRNKATSDKESIESAFVEHYTTLFGRERQIEPGFAHCFLANMPRLEDDVRARLDEPISLQEIEAAIDELAAGKSPGPDGLGAGFYRGFKKEVALMVYAVIREAYEQKRLPKSFQEAHMVLIPKTDDPDKLLWVGSYRPISLTNVDYKIFTKVLAKRIQTVIKDLVGPHQTCGIKGRTIATNIHVARSVLECVDAFESRVAMLQIDLAKAFDLVSHEILFSVLEFVNLGTTITEGVKMAYDDCVTRIIVNKNLTEGIQVRSSVRQGCPMSPLLFALYLEPFLLRMIRNENISGFRLEQAQVKVLAYADDIAVFCTDRESVVEVVKTADSFCRATGSEINWEKCTGFWHGNWDYTPERFANTQWTALPGRYLGVPLEHYKDTSQYWGEETQKIKEKAQGWQGRGLSMFTRATVCNVFLTAKVWYVLQVLCMTRVNVQKLHRAFAVFIWASSWERTSRTNLFRSIKSGGLGLSHLFIRQLVSRFLFLRDQKDNFLRTVVQVRLRRYLPGFIVYTGVEGGRAARGYLREVVMAFRFLTVRFSLDYLSAVNRKILYRDLVDTLMPVPLYRSLYQGKTGQDVLKRVKKMPVRPSVKSFFFKLHTNTLSVSTWMDEKGFFVPWTTYCRLCRKPETIEHAFIECWDPIFHWDVLQRTLKKELPITPHGIRYLPIENVNGIPYDMFMLLGLHSLWKTRIAVNNADVNARPVRENFIESIAYIRDIFVTQAEPPEWTEILDALVCLKKF